MQYDDIEKRAMNMGMTCRDARLVNILAEATDKTVAVNYSRCTIHLEICTFIQSLMKSVLQSYNFTNCWYFVAASY